ncbi:hypothetical protein SAMN00017405_1473 [Desulfonispora thiosulfatigenes DSM 11270]|uniref:Uncharacterized protein n=1 Tax=Desulfonispora thiosulfatigenes DSM 11270 TaxID=656914 RepID=A0A1W1VS88_DESTI|nr:hypothetical protein [Desulfonispora thiosulfatigenes]SMB96209.1 hypothetical protein SAMN00017405_1473 [Desulfonispora thiosulfatigenes DSM 11270]
MVNVNAVLIGGLFVFYFSLLFEVMIKADEEKYLKSITWENQLIKLSDYILVHTSKESYHGIFRGLITQNGEWIFIMSCEGNPRVKIPWTHINAITKV